MVCNRDCFNCPYPDCICDEETQEDIDAAERRDETIQTGWSRAEKKYRQQKRYRETHREQARAASHAHYAANRDYYREKHAEWYKANKERILAQQREYRKAHAAEISARKKEQYRKKKEAAQVQAGTAPDRNNDHINIVTSCHVSVKGTLRTGAAI